MFCLFSRVVTALLAFAAAELAAPPRDRFPPFGSRDFDGYVDGLAELQEQEHLQSAAKFVLRKSYNFAALHTEDPLWHPHSLERLLVLPERKLMVCLTDESPVGELLNVLNGKTGEAAKNAMGSSAIANFGWTEAQTRLALESDDWYKAVFLRDPLERFLLAFSRECTPQGGRDGSACLFFEDALGDRGHVGDVDFANFTDISTKGFERFPERFTGIDRKTLLDLDGRSPEARLTWANENKAILMNPHFTPQSQFCGGLNASHYDFVGDGGRDMHHQFGEILATVGAVGNEALLARLFQPPSVGSHASSVLPRAEYQQRYNYVDTVLNAHRIYNSDYQFLESATAKQQDPAQICVNTIFALDFEKRRILDWIAYHSLLGVNCFYLFHDTERSNTSDPEVKDVLDQLMDSPNVTIFSARGLRDRGRLANTEEWFKYFPARYLLVIDVDEFVVIDGSRTDSAQNSVPGSLFEYLEALDLVGRQAAGVYLSRWDYGTSGHIQPPSVATEPEFSQMTERWGAKDRARPQKNLGKLILNMQSGFPKYLSVHRWNPKGGGQMLFPNGTAMCLQPCGHNAHNPPLPDLRQPLSLNHYATGSLSECQAKAHHSQFNREDRDEECQQLHPGTRAYRLLSSADQVSQDPVMVKYAKATRARRAELFRNMTRTTQRAAPAPAGSSGAATFWTKAASQREHSNQFPATDSASTSKSYRTISDAIAASSSAAALWTQAAPQRKHSNKIVAIESASTPERHRTIRDAVANNPAPHGVFSAASFRPKAATQRKRSSRIPATDSTSISERYKTIHNAVAKLVSVGDKSSMKKQIVRKASHHVPEM